MDLPQRHRGHGVSETLELGSDANPLQSVSRGISGRRVFSSTVATSGTIEFLTSGYGVAALGLRFDGFAFTSLNVLENYDWVAQ